MTGRVGILAFGSLIGDPGREIAGATVGTTRDILTPFNVEFARSSKTRGGAPTLVPVDTGGTKVAGIIYEVASDEETAADFLYRREIHRVGSGRRYRAPPAVREDAVRIDRYPQFQGFDVVLSTRIRANISPLTIAKLAELAIQSAKTMDDGRDGISYLIDARKHGIATPLSPGYEREILRRLGVNDLHEALAKARTVA